MNIYRDSIIEEIHNTREKLKEQYAGDITAYSKSALAHCKAMGFKFATLTSERGENSTAFFIIQ